MNFRSGFISATGRPNVGKSTLINKLTGRNISIISDKPQTTRNVIKSILTGEDYQIVFMDTPGIQTPRNRLGEYLKNIAHETLNDVDIILFTTDAEQTRPGEIDKNIIKNLKMIKSPVLLVINKIDKIDKKQLLPIIKNFSEAYDFEGVFPVSAKTGDGLEELKKEIIRLLPEGPKYFPDDMITDQPERVLAAEIIREKLINVLEQEIPHGIGVEINVFKERPNGKITDISATVFCEKKSHKGMVIGKNGQLLKKIGEKSRKDIEKIFGTQIYLQLWVKVKDDWRNDEQMLKKLGFER